MAEEIRENSNFIHDFIDKDLEDGVYSSIQTRFPPEPNGYLHIGHAKAICINFGVKEKYKGVCNLRLDDTNPTKEDTEYVDAIKEDIQWLGFQWDNLYYASDYFDFLFDCAIKLIKKGKAFVCELTPEEMRAYRGTLTEPGKESPYRNRSVEENLDLFMRMSKGEFPEGSKVLRAKIDMSSPNLNMRDPIIYRIMYAHHHRTGDKWCVYPMYDFAHPLSDAREGVTHSLCSLEFENHRPLYNWFVDELIEGQKPRQIEFARLNLNYTLTSKRKCLKLVQDGIVSGWDDPRMATLSGMRRRGYPLAQVSSQRYFLDRAARTLNAEIVVDTGPPALLGEIVVEGNKDVSTTYIRDRAPWKAGTEPWNESRVQDYVDELRGLGLFSMVRQRNIKDVPSPRKDGMVILPVQLVVREGPPRSVSAAARYETDSGIGVEGEWEHRNFFGNGEKLVVSLPITPEKQGLKASFEKPAFLDRDQKLVGEASLLQEFTDAYDRRGLRVGAGIERRLSPYWWVGVGASSDSGTLTEDDRTNEPYSFVGPHLRIVRDSRNNKINPKRGSVLEINSKPIFGYYDGFFTALGTEVEGMFYYAPFRKGPNKGVIDDKLVLAARVRGGSMAGAEMNNLPSTLRYYAGGAGSVRGYSYQAIGPRNDKGDPSGGRSYQIVNLEARYKITDEIGIVPFLDGGMVYEDALPQVFGDMRWGAGLGLRYYTPIGPVRLDVATPLNPVDGDPLLQLYISIGQSF